MISFCSVLCYPTDQIIGNISDGVCTRRQATCNFFLYINFVSLIEPMKINDSLKDVDWKKSMKDKLNEFELHNVCSLFRFPKNKTIIGTR